MGAEGVHLVDHAALVEALARGGGCRLAHALALAPVADLRDSQQLRLTRLYPGTIFKPAVRQILVPAPRTARVGGKPLRDKDILDWASQLVKAVILDDIAAAAARQP